MSRILQALLLCYDADLEGRGNLNADRSILLGVDFRRCIGIQVPVFLNNHNAEFNHTDSEQPTMVAKETTEDVT